ncbi:MAG: hypothetical protein QMD77_01905 [Patescibacteria group bacterium]|nr:hypothetical protein [Patescibacteria group bacterium]
MGAKIKIKKTGKYELSDGLFQRHRFFLGAVLFLIFMLFSGHVFARTIDIDGDFSDWTDTPKVISGSLADYPYAGTTYYYNLTSDAWQTSDPGYSTCMFSENRALEVSELWMTNDNNYLYLKLRRGMAFSKYFWLRGDEVELGSFLNEPAPSIDSNPCAGRVVTAPNDFRHDMVLNFDKDRDGRFDYYLGFDIIYDKGAYANKDSGQTDKNFFSLEVHILEDGGDGIYTGDSDEVTLASLGNGEYEVSPSIASDSGGVLQELRADLGKLLSYTGMSREQIYNIRYASHSENLNVTSTGSFAIEKSDPVRLSAFVPRKAKKAAVQVRGKTAAGTNLRILVGGEEQKSFDVGESGRFRKKISVGFGEQSVQLVAQHASKGTNNISRAVTRKITRAADKPLGLGIVHSKNKSSRSIVEVRGNADGVSRVQVFVNDEEWGWAVVNAKTGRYDMKIRLSEGANTIKVVASKNDESVSVTKIVEKI